MPIMYSASLVLWEQPKDLTQTFCVPGTPPAALLASPLLAGPHCRAALLTTSGSEWMMRAPSTGSEARKSSMSSIASK
jgi:hypothetical protein